MRVSLRVRCSARALFLCVVAGLLATLGAHAEQQAGTSATAGSRPPALVWPAPPAQPRVRFVATISTGEDVTGKTKLSFIDRLAGRAPARNQIRLEKPYGVAVDPRGRIFVADSAQRAILVFDRNARLATQWKGDARIPMSLPIGVALDTDGRLFVSDSYRSQIVVFGPDGKPVAAFGTEVLGRPGGLAVDTARGSLYVADAKLNVVRVFATKDFKLLRTIGGPSDPDSYAEGTFAGPTNVAVDGEGRVYVTDTFNCRVQVFDAGGRLLRAFGKQGTSPGNFIRPKGIALDSENHVYVVDSAFNNIQIFTPEGKPLLFVGSGGTEPGQFLLPTGMTIDGENRIYVTEQRLEGGRLQIFQYLSQSGSTSAKPQGR